MRFSDGNACIAGAADVPILLPEPDLHAVVSDLLIATVLQREWIRRLAIRAAAYGVASKPLVQSVHLRVLQRSDAGNVRAVDRVRASAPLYLP